MQVRKLYSDYKALDAGIELQSRTGVKVRVTASTAGTPPSVARSDGTKPRPLSTTSFEKGIEMQQTARPSMAGVQDNKFRGNDFFDTVPRATGIPTPRPSTRPVGVQDNMRGRAMSSTSFGEMTTPPDLSGVRPPKLITPRLPPVSSTRSVLQQSDFHNQLLENYTKMPPAIKAATKANLANRVISSTRSIHDDYAVHYSDSVCSQIGSSVCGSLMSGGRIGASGILGAGLGVGISYLTNALKLDGGNPYVNSLITGTLSGGITEGAGMALVWRWREKL